MTTFASICIPVACGLTCGLVGYAIGPWDAERMVKRILREAHDKHAHEVKS